jgi:hypothetical protein
MTKERRQECIGVWRQSLRNQRQRKISAAMGDLLAEIDCLHASEARLNLVRSRLTATTDGTLCGMLHDIAAWYDWARNLAAEIADTGPAIEEGGRE